MYTNKLKGFRCLSLAGPPDRPSVHPPPWVNGPLSILSLVLAPIASWVHQLYFRSPRSLSALRCAQRPLGWLDCRVGFWKTWVSSVGDRRGAARRSNAWLVGLLTPGTFVLRRLRVS